MKDTGKLTRYKANINNDITIYEYKLNAYNKYTLSNSYIISLDLKASTSIFTKQLYYVTLSYSELIAITHTPKVTVNSQNLQEYLIQQFPRFVFNCMNIKLQAPIFC